MQRRALRLIHLAFTLIGLTNFVICIAMAIVNNVASAIEFNKVVLCSHFLLFATELVYGALIVHYARMLRKKVVDAHQLSTDELLNKIRALQNGALTLVFGELPTVIASIVFIFLGSFPYFWVVNLILVLSATPCIVGTTLVLFQGINLDSGSRRTNSKGSKHEESIVILNK